MFNPDSVNTMHDAITAVYAGQLGKSEGELTPAELKVILDGGNAALEVLTAGLASGGHIESTALDKVIGNDQRWRSYLLEL